jgi:3-dehydroquinate synthase
MHTVTIALPSAPYEVVIADGLMDHVGREARLLFPQGVRCAVVTDRTVAPLYADRVEASLRDAGWTPHRCTVPAGEPSKSFAGLEDVTRSMIRAGLDRRALVIALGGGVVGDLAGFAASVFFRGIPYLGIPTTILSMVDSSVGGKTGINTPEGKNLIGTFHQPRRVLIDPESAASLPDSAYAEGFAEIIKHAAIRDAGMLDDIARFAKSRVGLSPLIARNVAIKGTIVAADEFETEGLRALLNFGHTLGHAVEACAGYGTLLHGEAISIGMRAALWLSERHAGLSPQESLTILNALRAFDLPTILPQSISDDAILEKMGRDKKFDQGALRFVLLPKLGDAVVSQSVTLDDVRAVLGHLRSPLA